MKRPAWIFAVAVFLPSLVLGFLALRTAGEQRVILERQAAALRQQETDAAAQMVRDAVLSAQAEFVTAVYTFLKSRPESAAETFYQEFVGTWGRDTVPFAVTLDGKISSPRSQNASPLALKFLRENSSLLGNRQEEEFYQTQLAGKTLQKGFENPPTQQADISQRENSEKMKVLQNTQLSKNAARNVMPQKLPAAADQAQSSKLAPETNSFRNIVQSANDGILARFSQDQLQVIFWVKGPNNQIFGLLLPEKRMVALARSMMQDKKYAAACVAILNEKANPVALSESGFQADWKHPFVATEIGEMLPHWEAALYLTHPEQFETSARTFTFSLLALIALALGAIVAGGYFVMAEARRQMEAARKKTDFVSNVSHELKTPLTSIRMFSELLQKPGVDMDRRAKYLRIITLESERLTRLINNVLDFARIEGKRKTYRKEKLDLYAVIERVWEAQSAHLQEAGFTTTWHAAEPPYPILGDEDALAQILVNLLSNAEKYCGDDKSIELHTYLESENLCVSVLDRGIGVPEELRGKIFEAFYRANDSLSSGVQGSGLGLTLARRIAEDHGGEIRVEPRQGGGSIFTFKIPLSQKSA